MSVTVVEKSYDRRLFIRAQTPGAPPPPPPQPSHDEDPAPVAVVEPSNGRRLSIRALTPTSPTSKHVESIGRVTIDI